MSQGKEFAGPAYRKECDMCYSWQDPKWPLFDMKDIIIWLCPSCSREYEKIRLFHIDQCVK